MLEPRLNAWLRPTLALVGLAGILTLAGCGGGSGSPNNPFNPPPVVPILTVQPVSLTAYSGVPTTVTITSGQGPFTVFSSDTSVLPVTTGVSGNTIVVLPAQVTADTSVTLTVSDALGNTRPVGVNVKAAPILNALAFAPSGTDCGTGLCSGQAGTASVTASGAAGVPLTARSIRFDIVYGPIGIMTTNPGTPVAQTLTVVTDSKGVATVGVTAVVNAPTQPAQIRATDVTSGNQQIVNLTVVNNAIASQSPLTIVPETATITGAFVNACSTGFRIDYYIYGGSPPYQISSTFPNGVTLVNNFVAKSGGFFQAITNGACVNPLLFTIVDSAGKQVTATLINSPGTGTPPGPGPLVVSPGTIGINSCSGKSPAFQVTGGTAPYNAFVSSGPGAPSLSPQVIGSDGGQFNVTFSGPEPISGTTTIIVSDSSVPLRTFTATIACTPPVAPPVVPPTVLTVSPLAAGSATSSCFNVAFPFVITAGTAPFTAAFSIAPLPGSNALITPPTIARVGDGFLVTGLVDVSAGGARDTFITVRDSVGGAPVVVRVTCP